MDLTSLITPPAGPETFPVVFVQTGYQDRKRCFTCNKRIMLHLPNISQTGMHGGKCEWKNLEMALLKYGLNDFIYHNYCKNSNTD